MKYIERFSQSSVNPYQDGSSVTQLIYLTSQVMSLIGASEVTKQT
ncbi:hypothetical protein VCHA54P496_290001 [Vibrio chagasii]|nr:hypothetical protein VCHA54P496_290001 [Vibrio chagasii]CAH7233973.1 hypothetical protein VCHA54P495_300048 [Vibrio chagasii]